MDRLKAFFGNRWVQLIGVALLLFAMGYGTGRFATPDKVVEKVVYKDKVVEKIVYQDKVVTKYVKVKDSTKATHTETTTEKKPDGTVVTKTTTDTKVDTKTDTKVDKDEEKVVYKDRVVEKIVEKEKIVEAKKINWLIQAGAGVSIPTLLGKQQYGIPGLRGAVIQAGVSRRVIGPLFIGVTGDSQGTVGLQLTGAF